MRRVWKLGEQELAVETEPNEEETVEAFGGKNGYRAQLGCVVRSDCSLPRCLGGRGGEKNY